MTKRTFIALAALAAVNLECKSSAPPAAAEPATPAPPAAHEPIVADAEPREPATEPIVPTADGGAALYELGDEEAARCPMALADVLVSAEDAPNGIAIAFRTDGDDDETSRVREVARRWYDDLSRSRRVGEPLRPVRARVEYSEAPGGAVVMFVPQDLRELETLRNEVRQHEREMSQARACPIGPPSGVELARARLQSLRNYSMSA